MGYVYQGRKLCCDLCGTSGATKVRCPYGYCPACAACPDCKRTRKVDVFSREAHADCAVAMIAVRAESERVTAALAEGHWVRKAAVNHEGAVKVWFDNGAGERLAVRMPSAVYAAMPCGSLATLADYERIGGQTFDRVTA